MNATVEPKPVTTFEEKAQAAYEWCVKQYGREPDGAEVHAALRVGAALNRKDRRAQGIGVHRGPWHVRSLRRARGVNRG